MSLKSSVFCVCALLLCVAAAAAAAEEPAEQLIKSIDELDREQSVYLFGGLSINRIGDGVPTGPRSVSSEPIFDRAIDYLQTHEVKFSLSDDGANVEGMSKYEGCNELNHYFLRTFF